MRIILQKKVNENIKNNYNFSRNCLSSDRVGRGIRNQENFTESETISGTRDDIVRHVEGKVWTLVGKEASR